LIVDGKVVESVITIDEKGKVTLMSKSSIGEGEHTVTYRVLTPSLSVDGVGIAHPVDAHLI
jgi:hypothetical protein